MLRCTASSCAASRSSRCRDWTPTTTSSHTRPHPTRRTLAHRLDNWEAAKATGIGAHLGYQTRRDGTTIGLLKAPEDGDWQTFTCLNSLRDVEPAVNLILDDYGMERGEERAW